ncbi:MAG TPA: VOC family protein [Bryobacteraceae bacterium]|nr:VOC family protein [Bryobacteraceae bacterium]
MNVLLPHLVYQNLPAAIAWLCDVFGFEEHYRYGPPGKEYDEPQGAQLRLGDAWIMVRTDSRPGTASPRQCGSWTQSLTVFIDNVEAHCARSRALGATIVEEPNETMYGELQYGVEDLEGHHWLFSRHARDVNPADWGARVARG